MPPVPGALNSTRCSRDRESVIPTTLTHLSLVSGDNVKIDSIMVVLNYLEIKATYIITAYLTVPVTENMWIVCGLDFG